jgi:hypothetical protein
MGTEGRELGFQEFRSSARTLDYPPASQASPSEVVSHQLRRSQILQLL